MFVYVYVCRQIHRCIDIDMDDIDINDKDMHGI